MQRANVLRRLTFELTRVSVCSEGLGRGVTEQVFGEGEIVGRTHLQTGQSIQKGAPAQEQQNVERNGWYPLRGSKSNVGFAGLAAAHGGNRGKDDSCCGKGEASF